MESAGKELSITLYIKRKTRLESPTIPVMRDIIAKNQEGNVYVDEMHELWGEKYSLQALEKMWREVRTGIRVS